ncbi:hypothetical protein JHK82_043412 [Glycine max]|nr:hypothetical protein JHK82_043412 [Glycine max]
MKDRQRWRAEEDALLRAYVKQYGPREWNLVSQRMNTPLNRDAKSCLERWKNYLNPALKRISYRGRAASSHQPSSTHGNKWKKIAAQVPGRTAKSKYEHILESFAEKLVKERPSTSINIICYGYFNSSFLHADAPAPAPALLPSWLSNSNGTAPVRPPSPSVTLSLSPSTVAAPPPWMQPPSEDRTMLELDEVHHALAGHKKEAAWRLSRVELQLESEKAGRRREKMEEIEAKIKALRRSKRCIG